MPTTALARALEKLKGVKGRGPWTAQCPSHDDKQNSLSVTAGRDGRVLMKCHAGCDFATIVAALGLAAGEMFADGTKPAMRVERAEKAPGVETRAKLVKTYDYTDADGNLLFQSCRLDPKSFRQRRRGDDGEWIWNLGSIVPVLYRLPEITEAVAAERRVFVVEGEKDADTLAEAGYPATTNPMGAGKWREHYSEVLAGAEVVIIPDNDDTGRTHAEQVAASLYARRCAVRIIQLPRLEEKQDVTDWLDAGNTIDDLEVLIELAPRWQPNARTRTRWRLDEVWDNPEMMQPPAPVVPYLAWGSRSTLLAAREKSGKSTLTGYIAAQVSRGGTFLDEPCHHGRVLIVGLEEFLGDTARRLKQFGADGRNIELVDRFAAEPADRVAEIRGHIDAVKPLLVILDSLVAYSRGVITDANNATQTQAVVQGLTDLSHTTAVALIIIHHARKADGKYRDSSAIGGAVDIIAEVFPPDEFQNTDPTRRRVRPVGRVPARGVDFRYDGRHYSVADPSEQKGPLDQRITAIVRDRPGCSMNDVAEGIGEQRAQVLTRIASMIASGLLINDGDTRHGKLRVPLFTPARALL